MILKNQEMQISLGLPILVGGFNDDKVRYCKQFTLEEIPLLNVYLSSFDHQDLYLNFKDEQKTIAMASFFARAFNATKDEELDELLHSIDKDNFAELVSDVKEINYIHDDDGDDKPKVNSSGSSPVDWDVSINAIAKYTATPHSQIKDLTLRQFYTTLKLIGKDLNYNYKLNTISMVKDPSDYIQDSDNPLYSEPKVEEKKFIQMSDLQGLMALANGK